MKIRANAAIIEKNMLSIIIPTYNEEATLPGLLDSIKGQDYRDYEIIISDNKSSDRTRSIAQQYGARITEGGLPGPGRNRGAEAARGDKFLFLDADVVLPHDKFLSKTINEFDTRGMDIATCRINPISEKIVDHIFHDAYNFYTTRMARFRPHAPGFCIFVRRHIHEKINGFDEQIKLAEDHDYTQRAVKLGEFGFLSELIPVSVRRFEKDGRLRIATKYILCEIYTILFNNVKNDIFKYRFGYEEEKN